MKKYTLKLLKRILIFLLIFIIPLTIYEIIMQNFDLSYLWIDENEKINDMNYDKIQNDTW